MTGQDWIGTRDILYPKQRHYQAALHPLQLVDGVIVENPCPVFHMVFSSIDIFSCHFFFLVFIAHHHPAAPYQRLLMSKKGYT